jgi:hypothetical protein
VKFRIPRKYLILLSVLAFALVVYLCFPLLTGTQHNRQSEGLGAFKVEAFKVDAGWAYRIYQGNTPVIEQLSVPGIAGNTGFKTELDAHNTGTLVKSKLDKGTFPPTVTRHELDSMGVSY